MEPSTILPPARLVAIESAAASVQPVEFLLVDDVCTLGRSGVCQIIVTHQLVSRLHARIERSGPRYLLRDAGSVNGTFVNGRQISEPHMLADHDTIGLGMASGHVLFLDADPTVVAARRLRYDERTLQFYLGAKPLDLPPTQFKLLHHLYQAAGAVCTRESCAQAIWGRDYDPGMDADALDRIVTNLRSQLREIDPDADLIKTRRGLGYELT